MVENVSFVGSYSEWLMEYPELLENVIPFILSSLANPEVAVSSTMALKEFTRNCQKYLGPFAEHILMASQVSRIRFFPIRFTYIIYF